MTEEVKDTLIDNIIKQLKDNYSKKDRMIIEDFIDHYLMIASQYSNRKMTDEKLIPYVKTAVKMSYLKLGKEASNSNTEGGMSDSFIDIENKLKKDVSSIRLLP